jgi:sugar O-acyltransferase (sialic acid O-acetyltransferase NeuD family)
MTRIDSIVIYAVGSPLVAEVEESCRRLGICIAGAVQNTEGAHYLLDCSTLCNPADIDAALLRFPCIVPLVTPAYRRTAIAEATAHGFTIAPALVDPTAIVASSTALGVGSYVNAGAVIGAAGNFGNHVIINRGSSIGHHVEIGDLASIGPGAVIAGCARIGRSTMIGAGAIVIPKIEIGPGCTIGAGAVVVKNVPAGSLAVGNPARIIRNSSAHEATSPLENDPG